VTDQWDRFEAGAERHVEALGGADALDVFQPTETRVAGEGITVSYPSTPNATVDADLAPPDEVADRDAGGLDTDADVVAYVPADAGVDWTAAGTAGEARTRVEDTDTGLLYAVEDVTGTRDGLLRLDCVGIDEDAT
jgi:hypothetical protein